MIMTVCVVFTFVSFFLGSYLTPKCVQSADALKLKQLEEEELADQLGDDGADLKTTPKIGCCAPKQPQNPSPSKSITVTQDDADAKEEVGGDQDQDAGANTEDVVLETAEPAEPADEAEPAQKAELLPKTAEEPAKPTEAAKTTEPAEILHVEPAKTTEPAKTREENPAAKESGADGPTKKELPAPTKNADDAGS